MFERFSDGSRRAIVLAQAAAIDLGHRTIATEHLLLGVARAEPGAAAEVLAEQGATPDRLQDALRQVVPPGAAAGTGQVPFTPAAKKTIELSLRECLRLGGDAIDTGHLLLALLHHPGDEVDAVLAAAGVRADPLRAAVEQRLAEQPQQAQPAEQLGWLLRSRAADQQLAKVEAMLTEVLARLDRIEARLEGS